MELEKILNKLTSTPLPQVNKVALAFSGGLDSSLCIELFCLTKEEIQFKKSIDSMWAYLVYHGMWFHPLKKALDAFIKQTQSVINGTYTLRLYKGTCTIINRSSPSGLFYPEVRSIAPQPGAPALFDQRWCKNAAQVLGLHFTLLAERNKSLKAGQ